jgi:hypothetical protein
LERGYGAPEWLLAAQSFAGIGTYAAVREIAVGEIR